MNSSRNKGIVISVDKEIIFLNEGKLSEIKKEVNECLKDRFIIPRQINAYNLVKLGIEDICNNQSLKVNLALENLLKRLDKEDKAFFLDKINFLVKECLNSMNINREFFLLKEIATECLLREEFSY